MRAPLPAKPEIQAAFDSELRKLALDIEQRIKNGAGHLPPPSRADSSVQLRRIINSVKALLAPPGSPSDSTVYGQTVQYQLPTSRDHYIGRGSTQLFWLYVTRGLLSPGSSESSDSTHDGLPYFHLTDLGLEYFLSEDVVSKYYSDENSYLQRLANHGVILDSVSESYTREAVSCYFSGCPRATMVMIGVALENLFQSLLDVIKQSDDWSTRLYPNNERTFSGKLSKFARKAETEKKAIKEIVSSENHSIYITTMIDHLRQYRNDGAHHELPQRDSDDAFATLESFIRIAQILVEMTKYIK